MPANHDGSLSAQLLASLSEQGHLFDIGGANDLVGNGCGVTEGALAATREEGSGNRSVENRCGGGESSADKAPQTDLADFRARFGRCQPW